MKYTVLLLLLIMSIVPLAAYPQNYYRCPTINAGVIHNNQTIVDRLGSSWKITLQKFSSAYPVTVSSINVHSALVASGPPGMLFHGGDPASSYTLICASSVPNSDIVVTASLTVSCKNLCSPTIRSDAVIFPDGSKCMHKKGGYPPETTASL